MFVVTLIITIIIVSISQFSPAAFVRDAFASAKPEMPGQVLGLIEINGRNEQFNASVPADVALPPLAPSRPATPVKKAVYQAPPEISANSAVVFDLLSRKILYEKNPDAITAIASISKLMTALVVLDQQPDFSSEYVMQTQDRREGGRIFLFWGDRVTLDDLFHASLVGSGNSETIALVHALGMSESDFVAQMNAKAAGLGLRKTTFVDPIGLNDHNTSTAYELIEIARAALAQEKIRQTVLHDRYLLTTKQGKTRIIESTDALLGENPAYRLMGGKTGYITSAGFCFVGKFSDQNNEHDIISVVLGSQSLASRFSETDALVRWAYENYEWPPVKLIRN